ncbi:hypothetical protein [Rhodococcus opacus]|uniref:hypothetical protein n=1 Tax=Rhodococcus opacus TaxID=37919 RepID=UPI001F59DB5A|nr:hypothetical protein [Rhodococcus opacus]UNN05301.1 hypothetical protein MOO23_41015 [Rhodococcus opacus]
MKVTYGKSILIFRGALDPRTIRKFGKTMFMIFLLVGILLGGQQHTLLPVLHEIAGSSFGLTV